MLDHLQPVAVQSIQRVPSNVKVHAMIRYVFWCKQLGRTIPHISWDHEIAELIRFATPCEFMSSTHRIKRQEHFGKPAEYYHAGDFRLVVVERNGEQVIQTIEPDIHPGDGGVWNKVLRKLSRSRERRTHKAVHKRGKPRRH